MDSSPNKSPQKEIKTQQEQQEQQEELPSAQPISPEIRNMLFSTITRKINNPALTRSNINARTVSHQLEGSS